jgi:predicted Fe-S protein YdhL (DUF1289 family)
MDAQNRYCRGCKRTLGEIARWGGLSDEEQAAVLAQLPARQISDIAEIPPASLA